MDVLFYEHLEAYCLIFTSALALKTLQFEHRNFWLDG